MDVVSNTALYSHGIFGWKIRFKMKKIIALYFLLFFFSCRDADHKKIASDPEAIRYISWVKGTWKMVTNDGVFFEEWSKVNDNKLKGHGCMLNGNDTVFIEQLQLEQRGNELFYIAIVPDQNEGKPVEFRFTELDKGEFIFENLMHDFPQRITYKHPQPDFLCIRIEGTAKGKHRKEDFNFVKIR
jgi:hypothetical protein